jgi:hypothetical protein
VLVEPPFLDDPERVDRDKPLAVAGHDVVDTGPGSSRTYLRDVGDGIVLAALDQYV